MLEWVLERVLERVLRQVLVQVRVVERPTLHLASSEPSLHHAPLSSSLLRPSLPQLLPSLWHLCFPTLPWRTSQNPPALQRPCWQPNL